MDARDRTASYIAPEDYPVILRALVGSQAHGVAEPASDYDYREVFVAPTLQLLTVPRATRPKTAWQSEHRMTDDEGGLEVEPFLELCLRGHPNALELLRAPTEQLTEDGAALRDLLPALLSTPAAAASYLGYAKNARVKFLDREQPSRLTKWIATYIRVLWQGKTLLEAGDLVVDLRGTEVFDHVVAARAGRIPPHEALAITERWEDYLIEARSGRAATALPERPDLEAVNAYLLELRRRHWSA